MMTLDDVGFFLIYQNNVIVIPHFVIGWGLWLS